ncbi:MAG TPA: transposase family protein [Candidatus Gemmiger excrementigallinarum]|uniref:Transposase family protein n=1 Tax=Candidatus Gemmiger excrementigallinarum TaxID=2838609 RepID=A0A9D2ER90_9FIRM|nr:transposase family protein [Candidatus Gemmiger excrementigallinarum]
MAEIEIRVTDIITIEQTQYRVIGYRAGLFSLCEMNTKKLTIFLLPSKDLVKWATEGAARVEKSNSSNILLPDLKDENYLKKQALMQFIMQEYGPLYEKLYGKTTKTNLKKTMEDLGIQRDAAWRAIRRFLQSGLDMAAIVDGRSLRSGKRNPYKYSKKTGHPTMNALGTGVPLTDEIRTYFDEAIKDFLIGRAKTKKDAYMTMIEKHFINEEETPTGIRVSVLPDNLRPTLKQFLNYTRVRVPQEEIDKAKTSAREQRNNKRLLLSDNLQGVMGPGDLWEVDECEIDLSLVSVENPSVTVGRPIVYVMIDVYTRMIVAYSVAFDNNSVLGITNCFLNLLDDKQELCNRFGIQIGANEWPSKILPLRLRSDYGAEYISHAMDTICCKLGVAKELVSPATGSLKGQVEQLFHQIHAAQNSLLEGKGLIEKRYDSNHHQEAILNIQEFEAVLLTYIVGHNRKYMEKYPLTKDMRQQNVEPCPIDLWKYGVSLNGSPRPITNEVMFRHSLLLPVKASVGRAGITFKGLFYINLQDEALLRDMYLASTHGKKKLESACIDPRNIGHLYYIREGKLMTASLNYKKTGMKEYEGMTLSEYNALHNKKKDDDAIGRETNLQMDIAIRDRQAKIVSEAQKRHLSPSTENLRANRAAEKKARAQQMPIIPKEETVIETTAVQSLPKKGNGPILPVSASDALREFNEEEFDE